MLDVGWTEILVIAIVLIVVVGPKDLPHMLRTFGRMMTKMRGMAGEFRQQFDEALREADLEDVKKTIGDAQKLNPLNTIRDAVNPLRQVGDDIKRDLTKATSAVSSNGNPTIGSVPKPDETAADAPAAIPSQAGKPASGEAVAAEPLKKGPAKKTAASSKKKVAEVSEPAATRKAAAKTGTAKAASGKSVSAPAKAAARKPATSKTKKDQA